MHKAGLRDFMKKTFQHVVFAKFMAVSALGSLALPAAAQDVKMAVYKPAGAWMVGPAGLGDVGAEVPANLPCVAINKFGNGFTLRLSGGGGQLMAMAIDFHQKAFTPHRKYEIELSVPGAYFQSFAGAAYDQQTLLFGLYKYPDFYKALKTADQLVIKAAGASVGLDMTGLEDGFRRMESCFNPTGNQLENYKGNESVAIKPASKKSSTGNPLIAKNSGLTPMIDGNEPLPPVATPATAMAGPDRVLSVDAVLNDPAKQPPAPGNSAAHLIAKANEAEEAARRLSAKSPNRPGQDGQQMASGWTDPKVIRPNPSDIMVTPNNLAPIAKSVNRNMRWRALKGASLQDVLTLWADGAGVRLIWLPVDNFAVQRSLSQEGPFEPAVQSLLEQFDGQGTRPIGRIYREPGTNDMVLVVQQDSTAR